MSTYQLSCESTVDLPYSYVTQRNIPVLFYSYLLDGIEHEDDMDRIPGFKKEFYEGLLKGDLPQTTQINTMKYLEYFEDLLQKGDVLHICFGSGMTSSVYRAQEAAEELREKYPNCRLEIIDSFCSSAGYGLLVDYAADLWDQGKSMDEVIKWLQVNCHNIHHQFFTVDMQYFKRSGRVSGPAATLATVLNICPVMHIAYDGRIEAYGKVRGKKACFAESLKVLEEHAIGGLEYSGKIILNHSNDLTDAEELKSMILEKFHNIKDIPVYEIGTTIGCHCGPGTVVIYFLGDERS